MASGNAASFMADPFQNGFGWRGAGGTSSTGRAENGWKGQPWRARMALLRYANTILPRRIGSKLISSLRTASGANPMLSA